MTTGRPAKLRDGSWGARVPGTSRPGERIRIRIRTSGGKEWEATVARVLWSGPDRYGAGTVSVCSMISDARPLSPQRGGSGRSRRGTWTGCSCGSVEEYERPGDCRSCRHDRD